MQTRYISTTETAKIIRQELAKAFPGIKFSVKSKSYSGGSSVSVGWTDGPTPKMVEKVAGQFSGASFDPMIDLKSHHDSEWNGEVVSFGPDYVNCNRSHSDEFLQKVAVKTAKEWGFPVPTIARDTESKIHRLYDYWSTDGMNARPGGGSFSIKELIYKSARKTFFHNGLRCIEK